MVLLRKTLNRYILLCTLFLVLCTPLLAQAGVDSVSSAFFRDWYLTTDLGHYLDNGNSSTIYEAETTGEWNLGDQQVFSIAGNSFKNNKYHLNGMRIDSRSRVGSTLLHTQMDRTSMVLDYHDGELFFIDDSLQRASLRLTGNVGGLGGIALGTKEMINLFHKSASERMIDNRPVENRNRIVGAGTAEAAFPIRAYGRDYYQHAYVYYGQRRLTAFDHTGISGMYDAASYTAQLDGEIPLNSQLSTLNSYLFATSSSLPAAPIMVRSFSITPTNRLPTARTRQACTPPHGSTTAAHSSPVSATSSADGDMTVSLLPVTSWIRMARDSNPGIRTAGSIA